MRRPAVAQALRAAGVLAAGVLALAALAAALPACCGCATSNSAAARPPRTVVLGLDGMDHGLVRAMIDNGELPHLARLAATGGFAPLETTVPPQSPVAWSDFITGTDAGQHGIFDFVHRDPQTLRPYLSTSRVVEPTRLELAGWALPLGGGRVELLRRGLPFWHYLSRAGVPATVVKIPSHFPPRDDGEARVLSGMGTPDLLGTYGTFSLLTDDPALWRRDLPGGRPVVLRPFAPDLLAAAVPGPADPFSAAGAPLGLPVTVAVDRDRQGALVTLGDVEVLLGLGEWSDLVPVEFPLLGGLSHLRAVVRLYLKRLEPRVVLYLSPLNIDPADPALPISSPPGFAAELARRAGLFYTQGMPEDSKALASGMLSPDEFLAQAQRVLDQRKRLLWPMLDDLRERGGFLFFYFSSTDQISHMFFREHDPSHPAHSAADDRHADVIRRTYRELDEVVGRVLERLGPQDLLLVISDHGFGPASYLFDLNGWLLGEGYLALRDPPAAGALGHIDWRRTQAYGLGLNGLYLNLRGREREGAVDPARRTLLLRRIARGLLDLRQPATGRHVVTEAVLSEERFNGPALAVAPDLIVGYGRGFKVADGSALGRVGTELFRVNRGEWSGDHCGDHRLVPGILFSNRRLAPGSHRLRDLAPTILRHYGLEVPAAMSGKSVLLEEGG